MPYADNTVLKNIPEFEQLRSMKPAPLARYRNQDVAHFRAAYERDGLKGRDIYDEVMRIIDSYSPTPAVPPAEPGAAAPQAVGGTAAAAAPPALVPVFPREYDARRPVAENLREAVEQMTAFFGFHRRPARVNILDCIFRQGLSINETKQRTGLTRPTLMDHFIVPLFRGGKLADEGIALHEELFRQLSATFDRCLYRPYRLFEEALGGPQWARTIAEVYGLTALSVEGMGEDILIWYGDGLRIGRAFMNIRNYMRERIRPVDKQELEGLFQAADTASRRFLDVCLEIHPWMMHAGDGGQQQYQLRTEVLSEITDRVCRIIYDSPRQALSKEELDREYRQLFGDLPVALPLRKMEARHFFNPDDGYYVYAATGVKPESINAVIDRYIDSHVMFRLDDLFAEIDALDRPYNPKSKRAYVTDKCCISTDGEYAVLKGHQDDYPLTDWRKDQKTGILNRTVKKAVATIRSNHGQMDFALFRQEIKMFADSEGCRFDNAMQYVKKYADEGAAPKIFVIDNGTISVDEDVLACVNLDYVGKGYKHTEYYLSMYTLAVAELKKQHGHRMRISDFARTAREKISPDITPKMVRKAFFDDPQVPPLFSNQSEGRSAWIGLKE